MIEQHIKELEEQLLHTHHAENPALIDELLAPEFEEIAETGEITSRVDVITWLLNKDPQQRWELQDFKIKLLSDDLILAVYRAKKISGSAHDSQGSLRSSIWQRNACGWQMVFNQGTKITEE